MPVSVREGSTEVGSDLGHSRAARISLSRTQVVADIVVREDVVRELDVAAIPDLFVEAPN